MLDSCEYTIGLLGHRGGLFLLGEAVEVPGGVGHVRVLGCPLLVFCLSVIGRCSLFVGLFFQIYDVVIGNEIRNKVVF